MSIFDNMRKKRAAKQLGMTVEQYDGYLSVQNKGLSPEEYKRYLAAFSARYSVDQYLLLLKLEKKGFDEKQCERYVQQLSGKLRVEEYADFLKAEDIGMSLQEYLNYSEKYKHLLPMQAFPGYLRAMPLGCTAGQYKRYFESMKNEMSIEEYMSFLKAESSGLSYDNCIEYAKFYCKAYSIDRFADFINARNLGLTLEQYYKKNEPQEDMVLDSRICIQQKEHNENAATEMKKQNEQDRPAQYEVAELKKLSDDFADLKQTQKKADVLSSSEMPERKTKEAANIEPIKSDVKETKKSEQAESAQKEPRNRPPVNKKAQPDSAIAASAAAPGKTKTEEPKKRSYGEAPAGVLYSPGKEPVNIRRRIDTLFEKLDAAYPDGVIIQLYKDHHKWSETVKELYRALGYPDGNSFLTTYGYRVEAAKSGRPNLNHMEVIEELKRRYPNGSGMSSMKELQEANPDIAPRFKNLQNQANKFFGTSFTAYLVQEGVLSNLTVVRQKNDDLFGFDVLKSRYEKAPLIGTLKELKGKNPDIDWNDVEKAQRESGTGATLTQFLIDQGIMTGRTAALEIQSESTLNELKDRYPEDHAFSGSLLQLKSENKDINWMRIQKLAAAKGYALKEFLEQQGILKPEESAEQKLEAITTALKERYTPDKKKPVSLAQLREENPDLQLGNIGEWTKQAAGKGAAEYLIEQEVLTTREIEWRKEQERREAEQEAEREELLRAAAAGKIKVLDATGYVPEMNNRNEVNYNGIVFCCDSVCGIGRAGSEISRTTHVEVILPEGITNIRMNAFRGCRNLMSVSLPDSILRIGENAFGECANLTLMAFPTGLTQIGPSAFYNCSGLTGISIKGKGLTIGSSAFAYCKSLVDVRVDECVKGFGSGVFYNCDNISHKSIASLYLIQSDKEMLQYCDDILRKTPEESLRVMLSVCNEDKKSEEYVRTAEFLLKNLKSIPPQTIDEFYSAAVKARQKKAAGMVETFAPSSDVYFGKNPGMSETKEIEVFCAGVYSEALMDAVLKKAAVNRKDLENVKYKGSDKFAPAFIVKCAIVPYMEQMGDKPRNIGSYNSDYTRCKVNEDADKVAAALDPESFGELLDKLLSYEKPQGLIPYCRFGTRKQISALVAAMNQWSQWYTYAANGRSAIIVGRGAMLLSDTREAMLFADKKGLLNEYAYMRGMDSRTFRDTVLSDFGLDENGKKQFDIGSTIIEASINSDLSISLYDTKADKMVKTLPKRNADQDKYDAASAAVSDLKKNVKKVVKARNDQLFESFVFGYNSHTSQNSQSWMQSYYKNPVLKKVAELIVWKQRKNFFTMGDNGPIDSSGGEYVLLGNVNIGVAHPIDMSPDERKAWQQYFTSKGLKQPFEQVWEPVYSPDEVKKDRYKGVMIPYYRFSNMEKHGIHVSDYDFHNSIDISFSGCEATVNRIDYNRHSINMDDRFEIVKLGYNSPSRAGNHIIAYLDRITIYDRVIKDDVSVETFLDKFTVAQISEFIKAAQENKAANVLAMLLEYKNKHFADFDPMEEFTLDL